MSPGTDFWPPLTPFPPLVWLPLLVLPLVLPPVLPLVLPLASLPLGPPSNLLKTNSWEHISQNPGGPKSNDPLSQTTARVLSFGLGSELWVPRPWVWVLVGLGARLTRLGAQPGRMGPGFQRTPVAS